MNLQDVGREARDWIPVALDLCQLEAVWAQ